MKAEEFVIKMKEAAPSIDDYIKKGYSEKLADTVVKSYFADKKKDSTKYKDDLVQLIDVYDTSNISVGQIKFYSEIDERPDYYIVGQMEADWLIVDKITGIVRVVELYTGIDIWECAINGSIFLEIMLMIKKFIAKTVFDDLWDDQNITCMMSEECSRVAGGEQFLEFYKILLGCFE
jgi:hypothetical protein